MALFGFTPAVMKPVTLAANLVVGMIAMWQLYVAGGVSLRRILPVVLSSIPLALLGGALTLPDATYHVVVGVLLLFAALQLFANQRRHSPSRPLPLPLIAVCTLGISFLAGLTGVGSGILLSPLLVIAEETNTRQAAGVLAAFIFTTALAGLVGYVMSVSSLPPALPYWIGAVGLGVLVGTEFGRRHLGTLTLRRWLALVLVIASVKLLLS
jgi:uncharacterized membrane protein YfcA